MSKNGRVVQEDGTAIWYKDGVVHRDDGPAIERQDGTLEWYFEGLRHNDRAPAVISADGERQWFQLGRQLTEAEFEEMRRREIEEIVRPFLEGTDKKVVVNRPLKLKPKE